MKNTDRSFAGDDSDDYNPKKKRKPKPALRLETPPLDSPPRASAVVILDNAPPRRLNRPAKLPQQLPKSPDLDSTVNWDKVFQSNENRGKLSRVKTKGKPAKKSRFKQLDLASETANDLVVESLKKKIAYPITPAKPPPPAHQRRKDETNEVDTVEDSYPKDAEIGVELKKPTKTRIVDMMQGPETSGGLRESVTKMLTPKLALSPATDTKFKPPAKAPKAPARPPWNQSGPTHVNKLSLVDGNLARKSLYSAWGSQSPQNQGVVPPRRIAHSTTVGTCGSPKSRNRRQNSPLPEIQDLMGDQPFGGSMVTIGGFEPTTVAVTDNLTLVNAALAATEALKAKPTSNKNYLMHATKSTEEAFVQKESLFPIPKHLLRPAVRKIETTEASMKAGVGEDLEMHSPRKGEKSHAGHGEMVARKVVAPGRAPEREHVLTKAKKDGEIAKATRSDIMSHPTPRVRVDRRRSFSSEPVKEAFTSHQTFNNTSIPKGSTSTSTSKLVEPKSFMERLQPYGRPKQTFKTPPRLKNLVNTDNTLVESGVDTKDMSADGGDIRMQRQAPVFDSSDSEQYLSEEGMKDAPEEATQDCLPPLPKHQQHLRSVLQDLVDNVSFLFADKEAAVRIPIEQFRRGGEKVIEHLAASRAEDINALNAELEIAHNHVRSSIKRFLDKVDLDRLPPISEGIGMQKAIDSNLNSCLDILNQLRSGVAERAA